MMLEEIKTDILKLANAKDVKGRGAGELRDIIIKFALSMAEEQDATNARLDTIERLLEG